MKDQELFTKKIADGFLVCHGEGCPVRERCLRWKAAQLMTGAVRFYNCVNPHHEEMGDEHCRMFRTSEQVQMAVGMTRIFTEDMPMRLVSAVRSALKEKYHRTYFFEYRNGKRLIPPAMQEEIREQFRKNGWKEEVCFDKYVTGYDWG